ncbi:MAG: nucleotidyltransferase family protein [Rhodospirillales bacterium]
MSKDWTALVLAASRAGDPLAIAENVSNKTLVDVHGRSVLQRVIDALNEAPNVGRVVVAIEDVSLIHGLDPKPEVIKASNRVVETVRAALEQLGSPLLIVTGDHALLTSEMVERFLSESLKVGAGVSVAMASESVIRPAYPDVKRTYIKFADGGYSGCNLFALASSGANQALDFWHEIDRNRKRPWAFFKAIDLWAFILYAVRRLTLDKAMDRLSKKIGVKAAVIRMPMPEAAIDVDKMSDLELVRKIIGGRKNSI